VSGSARSVATRPTASRAVTLLLPLVFSVAAAAAEPPAGASSCTGCHAASAKVDTPVPRILGRQPAEIVAAMQAFRGGERPSTVMGRIAKGFSEDEIRAIAVWLATQPAAER
jgi:cytochrome subunit of sulfide dehydrogenase